MMQANWKPLENRLGRARCAGFMYLGRVNGINVYKHGISRSYLNLDDDGNCYIAGEPGCYLSADFDECLKDLQATLETPYDETFIARKREVLRQRGISLLTIQVELEDVLLH